MSKVCFSCGLTTDSDGNLIVNTSGTWPFACDITNGAPIYCDPTTGKLYLPPEKFRLTGNMVAHVSGTNLIGSAAFGSPDVGGDETQVVLTSVDVLNSNPVAAVTTHDTGSATVSITNPSACRTMVVDLEVGVNHAFFRYSPGGGGISSVFIDSHLAVSGDFAIPEFPVGHQIWMASGTTALQYDTENSVGRRQFTISAGGNLAFRLDGYMQLFSDNGNTTIRELSYILAWDAYNA